MTGRLPNLVVAGVNKAGTTTLFGALRRHPDVCASSIKETCYFLPLRYGRAPGPLEDYMRFFDDCRRPVVMEATPGYFYGGAELATEMRRRLDGVRVVVVLREPVGRLVSFFAFQKSMLALPEEMTLEQYVAACDRVEPERFRDPALNPFFGLLGGYYDAHLRDWMEIFGDRLRVLFFDDLVADTRTFLAGLAGWIGIEVGPLIDSDLEAENRTVGYRSRGAQRIVLAANRRMETVLRAHPRLKRTLRAGYLRLNGNRRRELIPATLRDELTARYVASNRAVAAALRGAGYERLPSWVTS